MKWIRGVRFEQEAEIEPVCYATAFLTWEDLGPCEQLGKITQENSWCVCQRAAGRQEEALAAPRFEVSVRPKVNCQVG